MIEQAFRAACEPGSTRRRFGEELPPCDRRENYRWRLEVEDAEPALVLIVFRHVDFVSTEFRTEFPCYVGDDNLECVLGQE